MGKRAARKAVLWEPSTPVCCLCVHYQKPKTAFLRESVPVLIDAHCRLGDFTTKPLGCCVKWQAPNGAVLDDAPTVPPQAQDAAADSPIPT